MVFALKDICFTGNSYFNVYFILRTPFLYYVNEIVFMICNVDSIAIALYFYKKFSFNTIENQF